MIAQRGRDSGRFSGRMCGLMSDNVLRIGMPAGSLADPNRGGNLVQLLEQSGFRTSGYQSGGPSKFTTVGFLYGWDGRPQEFATQLGIGELDVAIAGDDWIRERILELQYEYRQTIELRRVMSLKRGSVRLVGIVRPEGEHKDAVAFFKDLGSRKPLITAVAEMPYLALEWIMRRLKDAGLESRFSKFSVQKYSTPSKIDQGVLIFETWGKTEAKVKNGGADLGLEITQSGSAIKNYGLRIIDEVMESGTSIWVNPKIREDKQKYGLLRMFLLNLYGAINAENKVLLLFNVPVASAPDVEAYLARNNLFADEPSRISGKAYTEYSIEIDTAGSKLPLAQIRYELAVMGARGIDTIPLTSSIPAISVIEEW
jgi:ATP phosphoribosyltransferase